MSDGQLTFTTDEESFPTTQIFLKIASYFGNLAD